ncbi:MAG: polyprenyl diphosphate synthase [Patescibacteria group bacterium]
MTAAKANRRAPKTIGLIMDGNRRFARSRGFPALKGHELGYEKLKEFLRWAKDRGVRTVIAYAFSTENWKRTKEEVGYLMKLLERVVVNQVDEFLKEKIRVKFIGQIERLPGKIQAGIKKIERETEKYKDFTLVIALSYGGRAEIIEGIKKLVKEKGMQVISKLKEENFGNYLWTAGIPNPELIIRTSGEVRTSNFLPWQSAYSEWFFSKTFWPAFTKREFHKILRDFSNRERRNGR